MISRITFSRMCVFPNFYDAVIPNCIFPENYIFQNTFIPKILFSVIIFFQKCSKFCAPGKLRLLRKQRRCLVTFLPTPSKNFAQDSWLQTFDDKMAFIKALIDPDLSDEENSEPQEPNFIQNNRGNEQLVDEANNLYHQSKTAKGVQYMVCSKLKKHKCPGKATIKEDPVTGKKLVYYSGTHNHLSSLAKVKAKQLDRATIHAGKENSTMPPSRVLAESARGAIPESVLMARRKSSSIIRSIQEARAKEKGHILNPTSIEEVITRDLPDSYSKTLSGEQLLVLKDFITEDDDSKGLLIFMSPLGREVLRSSEDWVSDGTFKTVPRPFQNGQLYVVFGRLQTGELLPSCFALLPDKSSASYARLWEAVYQELSGHGAVQISGPERIGMDFEFGPAKEIKELFPSIKVVGCFFHFRKVLNDQIKNKGAQKFYNRSLEFQDVVAKCIAMALVPLDKINQYFILVESEVDEKEEDLEESAIEWFEYFTRTYVGRKMRVEHKVLKGSSRKAPLFQHSIWNKYEEFLEGKATTTNQAEAWNNAWKVRADRNPSFWSTIDAFKSEDALAGQKWRESIMHKRIQPPGLTEGTSRQIQQRDRLGQIQNVLRKEGTVPKKSYLAMVASLLAEI